LPATGPFRQTGGVGDGRESVQGGADTVRARALRISEERLSVALEGTATGSWEWDIRADAIRWSEMVGPLHGLERGAQPGPFEEYVARVHPEDRERFTAAVGRSVIESRDYELEFRVVHPDGQVRWLWTRAHVLADDGGAPSLLIGLTSDITERRQREDALEFIAQASAALAGLLDPLAALEQVAELAVPRLADWCVVQLLDDDSGLRNVAVAHVDPEKVRWARELEVRYPPDPAAPTGAPEVIRTGRSEIYPEVDDDLLVAGALDAGHLEILRELNMRSAMIVPLVARDRRLGAISFIATADSGRQYVTSDLEAAEELGRRAGLAVDHARLFDREHRTAETLQRALLPSSLPDLPGYSLAVRYVPGTQGDAAAGDFYDAFALPDGRFGIVIGDIVGRGIAAAATMGLVRNALRAYAVYADGPGEVLQRLYGMTDAYGDVPFATVLYLVFDPATGRGAYATAGHLPPLLVGAEGSEYVTGAPCPPLGSPPPAACAEHAVVLAPGSMLVLYTDGLVEDPSKPLEEGLRELARVAARPSPDLEALADDIVAEHSASRVRPDDIALLALRRDA
jgi:PAS domain S-box-containing protein